MQFVCIDGVARNLPVVEEERVRILNPAGHVLDWHEERNTTMQRFIDLAKDSDGVLVYGGAGRVTAEILDALPRLRIISYLGTGAARLVDLGAAHERGITVCNVPNYASDAIAEHTIALIFAVARRIAEGDRIMRAGGWERLEGVELRGRTLGLVGAGPIAEQVIPRARALGMHVICWTRRPDPERARLLGIEFVERDELLSSADVVSVHVAHTPETERMLDARAISLLKPTCIFINTARAELVDNAALFSRLRGGTLFGAGLDVFDSEPPPA